MNEVLINANPIIHTVMIENITSSRDFVDELELEKVSSKEIFDCIRHLNDPEHPLTLEQLNVVQLSNILVDDDGNSIFIQFTPTIPHCSMATLIGLCIRVKLSRTVSPRFKITVEIYPGSHQSETAVNKQLNDKERVAAALENSHLLDIVNKCIHSSDI